MFHISKVTLPSTGDYVLHRWLDPIYRVIAWSLNATWMNLIALPWFVDFSSDGYSNFKQAKVAYGGVFPSQDWCGCDLSGSRASLAGKCISGGV